MEIVTQTWQPCHSCSSKMAVRWRHCELYATTVEAHSSLFNLDGFLSFFTCRPISTSRRSTFIYLLTLLKYYAVGSSLCNDTSVCISLCLSILSCAAAAACGGFAAVGLADGRYPSTAAGAQQQPRRSTGRSTALSSKCEQCHVYSRRRRLNADLFLFVSDQGPQLV